MPILQVYVDEQTARYLRHASTAKDRTIEDLAESAVSETALEYAKRENLLKPMGETA